MKEGKGMGQSKDREDMEYRLNEEKDEGKDIREEERVRGRR